MGTASATAADTPVQPTLVPCSAAESWRCTGPRATSGFCTPVGDQEPHTGLQATSSTCTPTPLEAAPYRCNPCGSCLRVGEPGDPQVAVEEQTSIDVRDGERSMSCNRTGWGEGTRRCNGDTHVAVGATMASGATVSTLPPFGLRTAKGSCMYVGDWKDPWIAVEAASAIGAEVSTQAALTT